MSKILVAVVKYPDNNGNIDLMYVHVRNKYYVQHGIQVTVLNFAANNDYTIDGINVICLTTYKKNIGKYQFDVLALHAANLRNHYRFLKKYGNNFPKFVFFYHGHEVVKINEVYPEPYEFTKKTRKFYRIAQNYYDTLKLRIWHNYLPKVASKSEFIFVSNWLFSEFKKYVKLNENDLCNNIHIINNSVGNAFEETSYDLREEKKFDFITIRNSMDDSKYCIDLVDQLARKYKEFNFLIIGKGNFYKFHDIPHNVTWISDYLSHEEIQNYLNISKCGLLLTREDTQGVMACELAVYGIPLITSDIEVCHEMFEEFRNVNLVANDISKIDLISILKQLDNVQSYPKPMKFSYANTVYLEEQILGC